MQQQVVAQEFDIDVTFLECQVAGHISKRHIFKPDMAIHGVPEGVGSQDRTCVIELYIGLPAFKGKGIVEHSA